VRNFGRAKLMNEPTTQITEKIEVICPEEMKYLLSNLEIEEEEVFHQAVASGETITIVSDGGLKAAGGYGWVMANDEEIIAKGSGGVKGSRDQMSSFRSEITGLASAMKTLEKVAEALQVEIKVDLHTDNQALVNRIMKLKQYDPSNALLRNDYDAYWIIRKARKTVEISDVRHVRGHQDRTGKSLSFIEQLNVIADELATKAVEGAKIEEPGWSHESPPTLKIRGKTVTKREGLMLSISAERDEFEEWQKEKLKMSARQYKQIEWQSQHRALTSMPQHLHRFAIRYIYHWLPSGRRKKINYHAEDDRCPLCGKDDEKSSHFLRCGHNAMKKTFKDLLGNLRTLFTEEKVAMAPASKILARLNEWRTEDETRDEERVNGFSCENFLHGRIERTISQNLRIVGGAEWQDAAHIATKIVMVVLEGAAKMWGARCQLASNASVTGLTLGKKVRQSARVRNLLHEMKQTKVGHICNSNVENIMCRSDVEIDRWIRTNEKLLKKVKQDTSQPTLREFLNRHTARVGHVPREESENADSDRRSENVGNVQGIVPESAKCQNRNNAPRAPRAQGNENPRT
jgi:hypothetical protein